MMEDSKKMTDEEAAEEMRERHSYSMDVARNSGPKG
jgi:hypothetical protein